MVTVIGRGTVVPWLKEAKAFPHLILLKLLLKLTLRLVLTE